MPSRSLSYWIETRADCHPLVVSERLGLRVRRNSSSRTRGHAIHLFASQFHARGPGNHLKGGRDGRNESRAGSAHASPAAADGRALAATSRRTTLSLQTEKPCLGG